MIRYFLACIFITLTIIRGNSQEVVFSSNDWENPAIFEKGQNAPHAFHVPFPSTEAALKNDKNTCSNFQSLSGQWKFKWVEKPELVPEGFWEPNYNVKNWDEIKVPSNWQMEGFGHPKFRNIGLCFENYPPNIPDYYNPVGCYKQKFFVPSNWKNKEVFLRFEGIKSASYIWVNGKRVGYNQGGFEPVEFNITPFIKIGRNDLAIEVIRFSDGSYLENQDMWRLSGIYRAVKLYAQPKTFIHDYFVVTDFDEYYKDATLKVEVDVQNNGKENSNCTLEIDVLDFQNQSILNSPIQTEELRIEANSIKKVSLEELVENPKKWSAEFPNLYTLSIQLIDENGKTIEAFTKKIGFREVELVDNILKINGVPIKFNGVNNHMHHPEHGQAVPLETLKKDLLMMKQFNINCVRTSHYPPTPEYIEIADEIGMYIFDEVGDEAHRNIHLSGNPAWTEMYRDRSRKLVYRDRNHPSVVVWSAGNESGSGFNIYEVIKTGKAIDPSRPAWMYGGNIPNITYEDLIGPRYWTPYELKNLAENKVFPKDDLRPSFMDEYVVSTGNSLGGLDEYWEVIRKYPRLTGGTIWSWTSPGIGTPLWIVPDLSPKKNDGAIMGRPIFVNGKNGLGLEFSGHDDWVEFYRDPSLDITGNQLSIGFWVKPFEIPQPNTFIAKGDYQYRIRMNSFDSLEFCIYSENRISAKAKVDSNWYENWHHVAGIYDGNKLQLFIDEQLVAETEYSGKISHTPFPLCIGRKADGPGMGETAGRLSKMIIDDMKVFDKAVSIAELKSNVEDAVLAIDFESNKKVGDFFAVGLNGRTYGITWPDRNIQPEIHQLKKSGQPLKIEAIQIEKGLVKITNWHHFRNLNDLAGSWKLSVDGKIIQIGELVVDLPAQHSKEITIPFQKIEKDESKEIMLLVSFKLKKDTNWAKAGHEIAWEQLEIPIEIIQEASTEISGRIIVEETASSIIIMGKSFNYQFNRENGQLASISFDGTEYLENGPVFNVWRAPTANDYDPWGGYTYSRTSVKRGLGYSIDNQLRTLGMRDMVSQVDEIKVEKNYNSKVTIRVAAFSNSSLDPSRRILGKGLSGFERNETWTILADGTIELEQEIIPHGPMPSMLQKIGLQFQLPKKFNRVEWFGRGPFETYPDRKTGAKIGLYNSNADEMYVPYIIPQEYGNRTDVRWLKVQNDEGKGLLIRGDKLINFSLHKYSTDNLSRAMYTYQLKEIPFTILNVDYEVSGVGETALRQLQKYRVRPGVRKYKLTIKPY